MLTLRNSLRGSRCPDPTAPNPTGFIDRKGEFAIPPTGETYVTTGFSEGLCVIATLDAEGVPHPSVINVHGETVVPAGTYYGVFEFVGGAACVGQGDKFGCIDCEGVILVPIEFDWLWAFEHNSLTTGKKGGKKYIVDRAGRCVRRIALASDVEVGPLRCGLATVEQGEKYGYINADGDVVIPTTFDYAADFREELAFVEMGAFKGYIDNQGEFVWKTDRWEAE